MTPIFSSECITLLNKDIYSYQDDLEILETSYCQSNECRLHHDGHVVVRHVESYRLRNDKMVDHQLNTRYLQGNECGKETWASSLNSLHLKIYQRMF